MEGVTWPAVSELLQTSALAALALLLAAGTLIPRLVVEKLILAPRDQRIDALERAMSRREEEMRKLLEQQASALEVQSRLLERLIPQHHERGA